MHTDQLKYFVTIAELLSFTEASYNLSISQSSLSKQITKLEEELNVKLFSREKRQLQLTMAGREFLDYAKTELQNYQDIQKRLAQYAEAQSIIIGSVDHIGKVGLTAPIASFMQQFPEGKLCIDIQKGYACQVISWLLEGKTDLCFTAKIESREYQMSNFSAFNLADCYCCDLVQDEYYAILPVHHALADRAEIDWEDLKNEQLVILDKHNSVNELIRNMFTFRRITPHISFECNQTDALLKMVEDGYGITFLSGLIASTSYHIKKVKMKHPLSRYTTMIVKKNHLKQNHLLAQFSAHIEQYYAQ